MPLDLPLNSWLFHTNKSKQRCLTGLHSSMGLRLFVIVSFKVHFSVLRLALKRRFGQMIEFYLTTEVLRILKLFLSYKIEIVWSYTNRTKWRYFSSAGIFTFPRLVYFSCADGGRGLGTSLFDVLSKADRATVKFQRRIGAEKANMEKGKYGEILLSRAKMEKCDYMVFKPIVTANYHWEITYCHKSMPNKRHLIDCSSQWHVLFAGPQDPRRQTPDPGPQDQEVNVNIFHNAALLVSKWRKMRKTTRKQ